MQKEDNFLGLGKKPPAKKRDKPLLTPEKPNIEIVTTVQRKLSELYVKKEKFDLRLYQDDCIQAIMAQPKGSRLLVVMATGLGKTATFTHLPRGGKKMLIITDGKELVLNPLGYFDCPVGVEMAEFHAKRDFPDAEVICASAQSLISRLDTYDPEEFGVIIIDEAHHAPNKTFRTCIDYFQPDYLIGFTATPKRYDNVRLDDIFDKIVFSRDIWWGIENGWLCDVYTRKVQIDVDLRRIKRTINSAGETDFNSEQLAAAMAKSAPAIVNVYKEYAIGPTVINVSSIAMAYDVAARIPGAVPITGTMSANDRAEILRQFRDGKIPCLVNVSVLKEGVDIPNVETIIMARPTLSESLYIQLAGRGVRIYPGKKFLNLIDIEGIVDENMTLCSALTLSGIDMRTVPPSKRHMVTDIALTDLEKLANELADSVDSWAFNAEAVDSWAIASGYDIHGVNWFMLPDGHFELRFSNRETKDRFLAYIPAPDPLGYVVFGCVKMPLQIALDLYRDELERDFGNQKALWDRDTMSRTWSSKDQPITDPQKNLIHSLMPDYDSTGLSKAQASQVISRLLSDKYKDDDNSMRIYPVDPDQVPENYSEAESVLEGKEARLLYMYEPGPGYKLNVSRAKLAEEYTSWLEGRVRLGYERAGQDLNKLIARINKSQRASYPPLFFAQCQKYRYLCKLDKKQISRRDLTVWLAHLTDTKLPRVIYKVCLQTTMSETGERIPFSINKPPLDSIVFEYPESRRKVSSGGRQNALPKTVAEARAKAMEKWVKESSVKKKKSVQKAGRNKRR